MKKATRKLMERMGYRTTYWLMEGWRQGAALDQTRLAVVYYLESPDGKMPAKPATVDLPVRPMSNLLKPFGIPYKARCQAEPKAWKGHEAKFYPCTLTRGVGGSPIYEEMGAMPEIIACWIGTAKGVRQLQYEELAKAKGMEVLLKSHESPSAKRVIREGVGLHLWTAVLDSLGVWIRTDKTNVPEPPVPKKDPSQLYCNEANPQDDDY
jgi:hypothetical protein